VSDLEPFLGEICAFSCNFAPRGWAQCNGQLLPINQNQALFSLIETRYGGNGQTTFALPDLRGRVQLHQGQGPGITARTNGQRGGEETHTLTETELPAHTHSAQSATAATTADPAGAVPAPGGAYGPPASAMMSPSMVSGTGASQAHENRPPFLVVNWCIALQGIYPPQPT
jgi:microcystin-dependent protein